MLVCLDDKFDKYLCARYVDPKIPDDLLKELKKMNNRIKKRLKKKEDLWDFPR